MPVFTSSALIIVDVQNDFISGSLSLSNCPAKQNGADVVPLINKVIENKELAFKAVVYTLDWHPADHISFVDNKHLRKSHFNSKKNLEGAQVFDEVSFDVGGQERPQVLWPRHCQQNSDGADFHPDLILTSNRIVIKKGVDPNVDSYSGFWDNAKLSATGLEEQLKAASIDTVYICGIATDVCVKATVLDAIDLDFETYVVEDACRGVSDEGISGAFKEMKSRGAKVITCQDLLSRES